MPSHITLARKSPIRWCRSGRCGYQIGHRSANSVSNLVTPAGVTAGPQSTNLVTMVTQICQIQARRAGVGNDGYISQRGPTASNEALRPFAAFGWQSMIV